MKVAEYPERTCREPVSEDGLTDHFCSLPEMHPGPHAPATLRAAVERRDTWEAANPGWERLQGGTDPFAEVSPYIPEERA